MAVDRHNVNTAIVTLLTANATVKSLIGDPPRVYTRPPRNVTFPWVRMDNIPDVPWLGILSGGSPLWVRRHSIQFTGFALETSLGTVCDIQKAFIAVLDGMATTINVTGGNVAEVTPRAECADFDEAGTAFFVLEYMLSIEDTT